MVSTKYRAYIIITATSASRNVTEGTGERNSEGRKKNEKTAKRTDLSLEEQKG